MAARAHLSKKKSTWKQRLSHGVQRAGEASFRMLEGMGKTFEDSHHPPPRKGKRGQRRNRNDFLDYIEKELSS